MITILFITIVDTICKLYTKDFYVVQIVWLLRLKFFYTFFCLIKKVRTAITTIPNSEYPGPVIAILSA